jgi:hypothetical protein
MVDVLTRRVGPLACLVLLALAAPPAGATTPRPISSLRAPSGDCPGGTAPGYEYPRSAFEPTVAADPRDPAKVTVAWFQGAGMVGRTASTRDGGRSWHRSTPPGLSRCSGGSTDGVGDPLMSAGRNGRLYLASLPFDRVRPLFVATTSRLAVNTSRGAERRWEPPAIVVPPGQFTDKASVSADPRRAGIAYVTWSIRSGALGQSGELYFARTDDGGRSWSQPVQVYAPLPQLLLAGNGQVFSQRDGTLVLVFDLLNESGETGGAFQYPFQVMATRSTDGGASWSAPESVATFSAQGSRSFFRTADGFDLQVNTWPSSKARGRDGSIYVAWVDAKTQSHTVIELADSDNGGLTWSLPRTIANVPGLAFEPSIAVDRSGSLGACWYDMRHDRAGDGVATTSILFSESADRGLSWTRPISLAHFDYHDAPLLPGVEEAMDSALFLGDYQGMVGLTSGFAAAFAMPGAKARPERGPSRIFFARIHDSVTGR